jgi:hypothetical protein
MSAVKIIQIAKDSVNPIYEQNGYTPVTDMWSKVVYAVNLMLMLIGTSGVTADELVKSFNTGATSFAEGEREKRTAVEWAEFVMPINHLLWIIHDQAQKDEELEVDEVIKALDALYYYWHGVALHTLKGGGLSEYLRITD